ncbi:hypothetical protein GCM10010329_00380 [Streptomyces spiroverticillatus]|uniref:VanZ family protein n=1 Tax=Streptomyces finlayi TaxID=67296 RepID=A0A918WRX0_9ACTN|nr:hypothetical protein [Streptomyces finlayi]GGZ84878.1 hypothetical protein GCM10010329_00380 [Streptomyces spiroverticillatus]GHC76614.1 hypothetical protein GCM10010334_00380 [Streptomyces finlayi]
MIEASVNALPGVTALFLVLAALLALPAALWARARDRSPYLAAATAVLFAGALAVTLAPGHNAAPAERVCATGTSLHGALQTVPGQLNAVIFALPCLLLVLATRRPLTSLGVVCLTVPGVELAQALLPLGRSCTFIDLTLNCLGAAAGWSAGALLLGLRERAGAFPRSEVVRGTAFTACGALAVLTLFQTAITPVAGLSDGQDLTASQLRWARATSTALFGPGTRINRIQQTPQLGDQPLRIAVYTDKGRTELDWDHQRIFSAESYDHQGTRGHWDDRRIRARAEEFAARWFPGQTRALRPRVERLGPVGGPTLVTYRRYRHGVLMPMRLDFTLTGGGDLMALTTRFAPDPVLPAPRLSRTEAERRAARASGSTVIGSGFLLAEQVHEQWRPLWLVNVGTRGKAERAVRIDAVTGALTTPDPPRDY